MELIIPQCNLKGILKIAAGGPGGGEFSKRGKTWKIETKSFLSPILTHPIAQVSNHSNRLELHVKQRKLKW